ncbi:MAG: protein kinase domain-containing protein [Lacipirellulaceae bacterium]
MPSKCSLLLRGTPLTLPPNPWRVGGEGSVYAKGKAAIKLYHQYDRDREARLRHLVHNRPHDVSSDFVEEGIAWPIDAVIDERGRVVGSVTKRIEPSSPLEALFHPAGRRKAFPRLTYADLPRIAANVAEVVHQTHARGIVLGDLSPSNLLVNPRGGVTVIDFESARIITPTGEFPCQVMTPEYLAPELGRLADFTAVPRETRHDAFSLAVILYQILTGGHHPFDGVCVVPPGEFPPDVAGRIVENAWAFTAATHQAFVVQPPTASPPLEALGPTVARLFRQAFDEGFVDPKQRPDADRWAEALRVYEDELEQCAVNARHQFHSSNRNCPWCELAWGSSHDPFPAARRSAYAPARFGAGESASARKARRAASSRGPRNAAVEAVAEVG